MGSSNSQRCSQGELHQLQQGLLQKELSRINASRMSDVLLLKNLVSGETKCAQSVLKQVIRECSLRDEARASREEQLINFPGLLHRL